MSFIEQCPGCSRKLQGRDDMRGRTARCPDCGRIFVLGLARNRPLKRPPPLPPQFARRRGAATLTPPPRSLAAFERPPARPIILEDPKQKPGPPPIVIDVRQRRQQIADQLKTLVLGDDALYGRRVPLGRFDIGDHQRRRSIRAVAVTGVALLAVMSGVYFVATREPPEGPEAYLPTAFVRVDGPDDEYSIEVPAGWEVLAQDGLGNKNAFLRTKNERISINVKPHVTGSFVGEVATGDHEMLSDMAPRGVLDADMRQVHVTHVLIAAAYRSVYKDFEEGPIQIIDTESGGVRYSRYSGKTLIGTTEHGFRGTVLIGAFAHVVDCRLPGRFMDAFETHFERVLTSIEKTP